MKLRAIIVYRKKHTSQNNGRKLVSSASMYVTTILENLTVIILIHTWQMIEQLMKHSTRDERINQNIKSLRKSLEI